jgi:hypothetical protein
VSEGGSGRSGAFYRKAAGMGVSDGRQGSG